MAKKKNFDYRCFVIQLDNHHSCLFRVLELFRSYLCKYRKKTEKKEKRKGVVDLFILLVFGEKIRENCLKDVQTTLE